MDTVNTLSYKPAPLAPPKARRAGLSHAVVSEWTKLRTVRSTWFCLLVSMVLMGIYAFYYGRLAAIADDPIQPVGNAPKSAMVLVQFAFVVLAMQVVTSEYSTNSIRSTLMWVPVRARLLAAKSVLVGAVTFVAGCVLGLEGVLVAWPSFSFSEYATFHPGEVLGDIALTGLYAALISIFTIGISFALRSAAGVLATVFMILAALPGTLLAAGSDIMIKIYHYLPTSAGGHFMKGEHDPYGPVAGFLIVVGWALLSCLIGYTVLRKRDA
jgi:ABC-2 type transport system permease protein